MTATNSMRILVPWRVLLLTATDFTYDPRFPASAAFPGKPLYTAQHWGRPVIKSVRTETETFPNNLAVKPGPGSLHISL